MTTLSSWTRSFTVVSVKCHLSTSLALMNDGLWSRKCDKQRKEERKERKDLQRGIESVVLSSLILTRVTKPMIGSFCDGPSDSFMDSLKEEMRERNRQSLTLFILTLFIAYWEGRGGSFSILYKCSLDGWEWVLCECMCVCCWFFFFITHKHFYCFSFPPYLQHRQHRVHLPGCQRLRDQ